MATYVGTSGYAYKEWKGAFYPAKLPATEMLRFYASRLPTVEINNTFYRMPTERVLVDWADQVPEGFRFVLKAPQRITHFARLKLEDDSLDYFLRTANVMAGRLGPTLFPAAAEFQEGPRTVERLHCQAAAYLAGRVRVPTRELVHGRRVRQPAQSRHRPGCG
jgi:uncharacterized protein YecE (DUF72 family)